MKVQIYSTYGGDYGEYGGCRNIDAVELYMPATIEGLANEYGVKITTYGEPEVKEEFDKDMFFLVISKRRAEASKQITNVKALVKWLQDRILYHTIKINDKPDICHCFKTKDWLEMLALTDMLPQGYINKRYYDYRSK
jgi:hypothetical protein